ncbi:MAG TPA: metallophosphoesterase [Actinobacteria bacterium]|nr:metallophosphoesterase [Actinomycetota bacterium]
MAQRKQSEIENEPVTIIHISDFHAGSAYFIPNLLSQTVNEINRINPQVVVVTGDLTDSGFRQEYKTAKTFIDMIKCENKVIIPGNHDSRNVGYIHFEELFGLRNNILKIPGVTIVGLDSSEPDLDNGRIGRERYRWLGEHFAITEGIKILALHHHLLPVPGTGRERNVVYDAGDMLQVLIRAGVDLILSGHKHVPHVWRLEDLVVVTAGTTASMRLRGKTKPCYNVVKIEKKHMRIYRKYPFAGEELIVDLILNEKRQCKWDRVDSELGVTPNK